jgi:hypothetical protein
MKCIMLRFPRFDLGRTVLACQQFRFGGGELIIIQHAGIVELGELLKLCGNVVSRCGRRGLLRGWGIGLLRGWGISLLLCRSIGSTLVISLLVLILGSSVLVGPFLILVMVNCTGGAGHNGRAHCGACHGASNHSSSGSHIKSPLGEISLKTGLLFILSKDCQSFVDDIIRDALVHQNPCFSPPAGFGEFDHPQVLHHQ